MEIIRADQVEVGDNIADGDLGVVVLEKSRYGMWVTIKHEDSIGRVRSVRYTSFAEIELLSPLNGRVTKKEWDAQWQ